MNAKTLPLSGIRVLDFSHAAAGPFTTMFLGDLGAEIIKIEKPGHGDGSRSMGLMMAGLPKGSSEYQVAFNRGKKSVVLDLSSEEGVRIAKELCAHCDIVVQNFRPGVMDKLGLGFDVLSKIRPGLIYCSISAFGLNGPMAHLPANDIIMQGVSGLMSITGEVGGGPVRMGSPISDLSTGIFSLSGVLAALVARDRHPEGQHVEVSMLEASLNMMANYIPGIRHMGLEVPRVGTGHAQIVPYQAFMCADGEYVIVGAFTREFWQRLCHAVDHPEWITDERFRSNASRIANRTILVGYLEDIFKTRNRDEWTQILQKADIPNSPLLDLPSALASEQVAYCESLLRVGEGEQSIEVICSPIRSSAWEKRKPSAPPELGAQTLEVLTGLLGMTTQEAEELATKQAAISKKAAE